MEMIPGECKNNYLNVDYFVPPENQTHPTAFYIRGIIKVEEEKKIYLWAKDTNAHFILKQAIMTAERVVKHKEEQKKQEKEEDDE